MAAPERFAKRQIPLAPRAPSIHGPRATECGWQLTRCERLIHGAGPAAIARRHSMRVHERDAKRRSERPAAQNAAIGPLRHLGAVN